MAGCGCFLYYSKNPDLHFIGIGKPLMLLFNLEFYSGCSVNSGQLGNHW